MTLIRTLRPSYALCFTLAMSASGCVIVEPGDDDDVGETSDASTTDDTDTSTTDTTTTDTSTTDPTDTSTTDPTDTSTTDDTSTTGEPELVQIRFLNAADATELGFRVGGQDVDIPNLLFPQSHHYVDLPVAGLDVEVEVVDAQGNVVSNTVYPEFVAGHKYTVAAMGVGIWPNTWVNPDEHVDEAVPADTTRLTLVNATPDNDNAIYSQLIYDDVLFIDFFEENQQMLLGYAQQVTVDVPFPTIMQSDQMVFAAQWGVPAVAEQYWRGAALAQVANNESLYVFLTCQGACNSNADRFLLGFMEDSTPFTIELLAQP